jgi:uncharacterized protein (DUF58 family)
VTTEELMREVKRLEITTRHAVTEVFAGEYSSAFKGRGMEFAEVREYQPGDDIRAIDWNVTARAGRPFIKRFTEERELTVVLAIDLSGSERFGSVERLKRQVAVETAALLAFAGLRKNDRVALLIFTDHVELYLPPRKGARHTLRLVRELLAFEPRRRHTSIRAAADHLAHVLKRRSVVFVISDFLAADFEEPMRLLGRRHDLIALRVFDPREEELPPAGLVEFEDAETGERMVIDAASRRVRRRLTALAHERRRRLQDALRRARADLVELSTAAPYAHELAMFFRARERRR